MLKGQWTLRGRCTIDWFLPWPEEALTEVAGKYIDDFPMACPDSVRLPSLSVYFIFLSLLNWKLE